MSGRGAITARVGKGAVEPFAPTQADVGRAVVYSHPLLTDAHGTLTGIVDDRVSWVLFRGAGGRIKVGNGGLSWAPERKAKSRLSSLQPAEGEG